MLNTNQIPNVNSLFKTCEWDKCEDMLRKVLQNLPNISDRGFDLAAVACEQYLDGKGKFRLKPTFNKATSELDSFINKAQRLLAAIAEMDPVVFRDFQFATHDCPELFIHSNIGLDLNDFSVILDALIGLAKRSEEWLDITKGTSRPTERTYLRDAFIRVMATVFEKEKTIPALAGVKSDNEHNNQGGEFYDLIWDCLIAGGYEPGSGVEIENAIRKKLKDRTPLIKPWPA